MAEPEMTDEQKDIFDDEVDLLKSLSNSTKGISEDELGDYSAIILDGLVEKGLVVRELALSNPSGSLTTKGKERLKTLAMDSEDN